MRDSTFRSVRRAFIAGVIVLTPISVTVFVLTWLVNMVGGRYSKYFFFWMPEDLFNRQQLTLVWNIIATVLMLLVITLLGYLSRYVVTRFFVNAAENLMARLPLIGVIYKSVKQIVDTFSTQQRAIFDRVVVVPFPRDGSYAIGFLTSRTKGEIQRRLDDEVWNVFVPTTPNPTSGFLVLFPREQIIELDMTVGEGMKMIISGGAVVPPWPPSSTSSISTEDAEGTPESVEISQPTVDEHKEPEPQEEPSAKS